MKVISRLEIDTTRQWHVDMMNSRWRCGTFITSPAFRVTAIVYDRSHEGRRDLGGAACWETRSSIYIPSDVNVSVSLSAPVVAVSRWWLHSNFVYLKWQTEKEPHSMKYFDECNPSQLSFPSSWSSGAGDRSSRGSRRKHALHNTHWPLVRLWWDVSDPRSVTLHSLLRHRGKWRSTNEKENKNQCQQWTKNKPRKLTGH